MFFGTTTAYQKTRAQQILTEPDLYKYYLENYASKFILSKTERGKRRCFYLWKCDVENMANAVTIL